MFDQSCPFRADLAKYYQIHFRDPQPSLPRRLRLWLEHHGLHCVAVYRFSRLTDRLAARSRLAALPLKPLRHLLNQAMALLHHVEIDADIGPGFYIGHPGNIFLSARRIGRNFSVTHNVSIGIAHQRDKTGLPEIGDDVWIGTGSTVAGPISIGDQVTIAHGSMVTRDIPSGSLVAGSVARLVLRDFDNQHLFGADRPERTDE